MKFASKLVIAALLSLSIGIAAATPLMISELNILPFPRLPEGPKADTNISIVYANFTATPNGTDPYGVPKSTLNYQVVLNVTNLSNLGAEIESLAFAAAQDIYVEPSAVGFLESARSTSTSGGGSLGGTSASVDMIVGYGGRWSEYRDGITTTGGYGLVRGVWLDDQWTNVTWIPGIDYPSIPWQNGNWTLGDMSSPADRPSLRDCFPTATTVPALPENASTQGSWIEGVPIMELHNITVELGKTINITTSTAIFINGAWVDVTDRVRTEHQEPYVRMTNALAIEKRLFEDQPDLTNYAEPPFQPNAAWITKYTSTETAEDKFNDYWEPKQSRLIMLSGTREIYDNEILQNTLDAQKIMLFADEFNYVQDTAVNNTALYTYSGSQWFDQVELQKNQNSYIYNAALSDNQMFQLDQWGVEVFIASRS
jgi:hypothetical protein